MRENRPVGGPGVSRPRDHHGLVSRFFSALGGLFLLLLAFSLFGVPIVETLADPENADFPGGASGIVFMLLLMASVPLVGGVVLLRRAIRGATPDQLDD